MTLVLTPPVSMNDRGTDYIGTDLQELEDAFSMLSPRLHRSGRGPLSVVTVQPIGVITLLALPSTSLHEYSRHLAIAVAVGNIVVAAPLTAGQAETVAAFTAACPGQVRLAGEGAPQQSPDEGLLVVLGIAASGSMDGSRGTHIGHDEPAETLRERYSHTVIDTMRVRSSYVAPGIGTSDPY